MGMQTLSISCRLVPAIRMKITGDEAREPFEVLFNDGEVGLDYSSFLWWRSAEPLDVLPNKLQLLLLNFLLAELYAEIEKDELEDILFIGFVQKGHLTVQ